MIHEAAERLLSAASAQLPPEGEPIKCGPTAVTHALSVQGPLLSGAASTMLLRVRSCRPSSIAVFRVQGAFRHHGCAYPDPSLTERGVRCPERRGRMWTPCSRAWRT